MSRVEHLARRFFWSLKSVEVDPVDLDWARSALSGPEFALFEKMRTHDQVHSIAVARDVAAELELSERSWVVAAALLHDVGKVESGVGVAGRVVAAVLEPVMPDRFVEKLAGAPGWAGRVGAHLRYTEMGAVLLGSVGSDPRVRAWAREHHLDRSRWTVPPVEGLALRAADDRAMSGVDGGVARS